MRTYQMTGGRVPRHTPTAQDERRMVDVYCLVMHLDPTATVSRHTRWEDYPDCILLRTRVGPRAMAAIVHEVPGVQVTPFGQWCRPTLREYISQKRARARRYQCPVDRIQLDAGIYAKIQAWAGRELKRR